MTELDRITNGYSNRTLVVSDMAGKKGGNR